MFRSPISPGRWRMVILVPTAILIMCLAHTISAVPATISCTASVCSVPISTKAIAPMINIENGTVVDGFSVEMTDYLLSEMGTLYGVTFVPEWIIVDGNSEIFTEVQERRATMGVAAVTMTKERLDTETLFSSPFLRTGLIGVSTKDATGVSLSDQLDILLGSDTMLTIVSTLIIFAALAFLIIFFESYWPMNSAKDNYTKGAWLETFGTRKAMKAMDQFLTERSSSAAQSPNNGAPQKKLSYVFPRTPEESWFQFKLRQLRQYWFLGLLLLHRKVFLVEFVYQWWQCFKFVVAAGFGNNANQPTNIVAKFLGTLAAIVKVVAFYLVFTRGAAELTALADPGGVTEFSQLGADRLRVGVVAGSSVVNYLDEHNSGYTVVTYGGVDSMLNSFFTTLPLVDALVYDEVVIKAAMKDALGDGLEGYKLFGESAGTSEPFHLQYYGISLPRTPDTDEELWSFRLDQTILTWDTDTAGRTLLVNKYFGDVVETTSSDTSFPIKPVLIFLVVTLVVVAVLMEIRHWRYTSGTIVQDNSKRYKQTLDARGTLYENVSSIETEFRKEQVALNRKADTRVPMMEATAQHALQARYGVRHLMLLVGLLFRYMQQQSADGSVDDRTATLIKKLVPEVGEEAQRSADLYIDIEQIKDAMWDEDDE